jgi:hypothetical protein
MPMYISEVFAGNINFTAQKISSMLVINFACFKALILLTKHPAFIIKCKEQV